MSLADDESSPLPSASPVVSALADHPLPDAAVATSRVDQLSVSPPHPSSLPSNAFELEPSSPPPAAPAPAQSKAAEPLALIPTFEELQLSRQRAQQSQKGSKKPHPADLVTSLNPDPHPSPPISPSDSFSPEIGGRNGGMALREDRERETEDEGDAEGSENGVTVGHGDEDSMHHHSSPSHHRGSSTATSASAAAEEDRSAEVSANGTNDSLTPLASATKSPLTANDLTTTPRKATAGHARSQSLASPSPSSPARNGAPSSPSQRPPTTSTSSRDPSNRDRERERERRSDRDPSSSFRPERSEKDAAAGSTSKESSSSRSRRTLGEYTLGKTLGAGSMGKVKLGTSGISGEKVAIKIIPRFTSTAAAHRPPPPPPPALPSSTGAPSSSAAPPPTAAAPAPAKPTEDELSKAAAKDHSKEVRTMREGSISMLLHHPYVCGMRGLMLYPHHYYMIFEYVNGGQMLDYIISHGRLRERSARKFARQIGSALEYCHANSIVHRDLKIENILISKTGNIKIIDFGLSNLYAPTSHLSTFCGSLYFAAPELLNAKPYTGPEVDVWSFGIVLYVLVCGKVPFDDQSMPALHAKIKRGQVEYPGWLSAECKHLLARMLVTTPSTRATLTEVLSHPWITKGFTGPPASHLPPRVPLRSDEIDPELIKGMSGFELGTEEEIERRLREVLESDVYRGAVRNWEIKRANGSTGVEDPAVEGREVSDKERPATRIDGKDMKGLGRSPTNKRFSGLGFYGKKLAGGINAAFAGGGGTAGKEDGEGGAGSGQPNGSMGFGSSKLEQLDPTRGFHPLISLYFLVKEKIEREKIWGPGVFASSTLSLTGPPPPPAPAQAYQAGSGVVPPAPAASLAKPPPSAIATAAANAQDVPPPIASPLPVPLTPQPRQRATGEEYPSHHPSTAPQRSRFDSTGDYRHDPSKRSSFHPGSSAPTSPAIASHFAQRPQSSYEPSSPTPQRIIDRTGSGVGSHMQDQQPHVDDVPLSSSPSGFARRFGSLLGRSAPSSTSADPNYKPSHRQRASIGGSVQHKASHKAPASALPQVNETSIRASGSDVPLPSPAEGKAVHRSSTVGELSPNRHQRGVSMGAGSPATVGRAAGSSFGAGGAGSSAAERRRLMNLGGGKEEGRPSTAGEAHHAVFDEAQEELSDSAAAGRSSRTNANEEAQHQQDVGFVGRTAAASGSGSEQAKPVWLKGLFSVTTTSTKPAAMIRADLIRVLDRLGVQHRDVKSGFECAHVPSIDLSSVGAGKKDKGGTIRRRASKLLLSTKEKDPSTAAEESSTSLGASQAGATNHASSTSFDPMSPTVPDSAHGPGASPPTANNSKFISSTAEGSTISSDLIVRFEIFIVRMPLLPGISGLQFRRIGGNSWQYQMLARRVLAELKL